MIHDLRPFPEDRYVLFPFQPTHELPTEISKLLENSFVSNVSVILCTKEGGYLEEVKRFQFKVCQM